jgi:hypothetical protein
LSRAASVDKIPEAKPCRVNVTVYGPGRSSTTRYSPRSFVVVARTFSISTGLESSTREPAGRRTRYQFNFDVYNLSKAASSSGQQYIWTELAVVDLHAGWAINQVRIQYDF